MIVKLLGVRLLDLLDPGHDLVCDELLALQDLTQAALEPGHLVSNTLAEIADGNGVSLLLGVSVSSNLDESLIKVGFEFLSTLVEFGQ